MAEQLTFFGDNPEYDAFVAKFEPKKTTDDCYTPPMVYEAVRDWACAEYGLDPARIVRPFYPGGDYERFDYGDGAVVLDNPPFSILAQIIRFYQRQAIPFFLFGPTLTAFGGKDLLEVCHLICDTKITYENGAVVNTSFVTNLEPGVVARSAPGLYQAVTRADARNRAAANRAAAERENRIVWELSEREWAIVKNLGQKEGSDDGERGTEPGL